MACVSVAAPQEVAGQVPVPLVMHAASGRTQNGSTARAAGDSESQPPPPAFGAAPHAPLDGEDISGGAAYPSALRNLKIGRKALITAILVAAGAIAAGIAFAYFKIFANSTRRAPVATGPASSAAELTRTNNAQRARHSAQRRSRTSSMGSHISTVASLPSAPPQRHSGIVGPEAGVRWHSNASSYQG